MWCVISTCHDRTEVLNILALTSHYDLSTDTVYILQQDLVVVLECSREEAELERHLRWEEGYIAECAATVGDCWFCGLVDCGCMDEEGASLAIIDNIALTDL